MLYSVVDNAPNWGLRTKCYKNKGQALLYARNLKKHLALGYIIKVQKIDVVNNRWDRATTIALLHSIGNNKGVKIIKK